jgi:translation initiation factor IF-2
MIKRNIIKCRSKNVSVYSNTDNVIYKVTDKLKECLQESGKKQNQRQEWWKGKKTHIRNIFMVQYICNGRLNWVSTSDESS